MAKQRWYEGGLLFECVGCGACCRTHGEYAFVYLSDEDADRMAAHLKLSRIDFLNRYCATDSDGDIHLAELSGDCSFLESGVHCRVYPARPKQCETWPFWRENLERSVWEGPVSACCPGIGKGRRYTADEIDGIADARDVWYRS